MIYDLTQCSLILILVNMMIILYVNLNSLYIEARQGLYNKVNSLKINKIFVCSHLVTMIQIISTLFILSFTGRFLHRVWALPPWPYLYRISRLCPVIWTAEFNHPQPWHQQTWSTFHIKAKQEKSVSESWGGNEFVSSSCMVTYSSEELYRMSLNLTVRK